MQILPRGAGDLFPLLKGQLPKASSPSSLTMETSPREQYLEALLGRTLRIHTTDTRVFVGEFKCTDNVSSQYCAVPMPTVGADWWPKCRLT